MMRRLWLGIGILALLLGLCVWVQLGMCELHKPIAQGLEDAAQAALDEDWEQATALFQAAQSTWQKRHSLTASVADHSPMDELDMLFAELTVFARQRETVHFAATCLSAAEMAQAMAQAHTLTWWNLL